MHRELIILRKQHKLTKKDMAHVLKINPKTYSMKEDGLSDFKYKEIFLIAKMFNRNIDEIFLPPNIRKTDKNVN
ncbi:transcriptional regulator [Oceanobacillus arenosus]|uniref:Transcriptional regulator n=1 Tax=Oceanobacillus arenosus TaxID=1229153 RepID=A0A3D8PR06_9BACI|nr:helix-turn-helix domain-containing protein [Oceanobacillus arenosus]RDW17599.1 transcriptional regulator [Oceanobacillus arenosus]